jgi:hypothetical protein
LHLLDRNVPDHLAAHIDLDKNSTPQDPVDTALARPPPRFHFSM